MSKSTSRARANANVKERAQTQCNRILDAAERCFIRHGFHAASMASIAETAGMSAGLIYRYFENKRAIILAIIERQLQEKRANIASLQTSSDLAGRIDQLFAGWRESDPRAMNPVLFLEMSAEASRDPEIARALGNADRLSRSDFSAWLKQLAAKSGRKVTDREIERRSFALQCFIEGMLIRVVREPDLDPAVLARSVEMFLPQVVSFPATKA